METPIETNIEINEIDKRSKIFFIVFFLLIAGAISATYYRTMVAKDYIVEAQTDCDPTVDKCFIWECDPNATDESEKCTGDEEKDIWYYQLSFRNASRVGLCDPDKDENCTPMVCDPGEKDCSTVFCDDASKKQYEQEAECNDPVEYVKNNPPEEDEESEEGDEEECAPADQACLEESSSDENSSDEEKCDAASGDTCSIDSEAGEDESSEESSSTVPAPTGTVQPSPAPTQNPVPVPISTPAPVK